MCRRSDFTIAGIIDMVLQRMTITLQKSYTMPLTQQFAIEVSKMDRWAGERDPIQPHLETIRAIIENGECRTFDWAFATLDGKKYRVNGQHSSMELAVADTKYLKNLFVSVEEWTVDTEDDLQRLFRRFDSKWSTRTVADIIGAAVSSDPKLRNIKRSWLNPIARGIQLALFDKRAYSTNDHAQHLIDQSSFVEDVVKLTAECTQKYRRAPIMAAMFKTWNVDEDKADWQTFWTLVINESGTDPNSGDRVLGRFLRDAKQWTDRAILAKCIYAWNAYRAGTTTALRYTPDKDIPEAK